MSKNLTLDFLLLTAFNSKLNDNRMYKVKKNIQE